MQIMVFQLNDLNYYGINVSKVKSLEDILKYNISKNSINNATGSGILHGYIDHQGQILPLLGLEKWLGFESENDKHNVIIISEFNKKVVALPVFNILKIYNVSISDLQTDHIDKDKITYTTILDINDEKNVCYILDVEELISKIFDATEKLSSAKRIMTLSDKLVLIAEDSNISRKIIEEIMSKSDVGYKMFEDGEKIIEYMKKLSDDEIANIGVVITDIEMPHMDGYQVINFMKTSQKLKHIPILVNTSMSNTGVVNKTKTLGANGFIAKLDPDLFLKFIYDNIS
jgi:two-component system chemotaxis response regulator CheV